MSCRNVDFGISLALSAGVHLQSNFSEEHAIGFKIVDFVGNPLSRILELFHQAFFTLPQCPVVEEVESTLMELLHVADADDAPFFACHAVS